MPFKFPGADKSVLRNISPTLKLGVGGLEVTAGTPKGTAGEI